MKAPQFWYEPNTWKAKFLYPLGYFYNLLTLLRGKLAKPQSYSCLTICIGNLNVGGTGKTPTTIALAQHFLKKGLQVHVVSRGYKGKFQGTFLVDPQKHKSDEVGDEPLLMSEFTSVWVSNKRKNGIAAAENAGAQIVLLDDGFQDPSFHKDFSLIVVDGEKGFGNKKCMPAGPLRENIVQGFKRADALVIVGQRIYKFDTFPTHLKIIHSTLKPIETGMNWKEGKYLAFAGIADPSKFFKTLRSLGANLIDCVALSDHQNLDGQVLKRLERKANSAHAQLVTTEKDAVRLSNTYRKKVLSLPVRIEFDDKNELENLFNI
ncbi:MAG: tetraacyldisaccharide 4'-kinase [Paracoccaceae bacterium]|jgi:tetraacyldisaccharide 4'-kinase|tara:strand:- start:8354 stop:9313 length:960 start_codon:yes stop_codon:yes gene_type:complete